MNIRWLVTGARGQLGTDLVRALDGAELTAFSRFELDIADASAVEGGLRAWAAGGERLVVLNAAAYTEVDGAQADEARAFAVNADGPAALAAACGALGATLVHVSTDYVFAGNADTPYEVDAPTGPRSVYGASKLAGEQRVRAALDAHYVVRTSWMYGDVGRNFVKTMARLQAQRPTVDVVDDQRGSPTWSADLAAALVSLARSGAPFGTYHCASGGETTWCGLARAVFAELGADPQRVRPCSTAQYPRPAPRPAYSVLSNRSWRAAGLPPIRPWRDALAAAFAEHGEKLRGDRTTSPSPRLPDGLRR